MQNFILSNLHEMSKVTTNTVEFELDEKEVLWMRILPDARIDFEDALDNALVIRHLTGGKKILKLTDSRNAWSITKKGKKVIFEENERQTIARAIVVSTKLGSEIRNMYLKLNSTEIPVRFFSDVDEAYAWLLEMKTQ